RTDDQRCSPLGRGRSQRTLGSRDREHDQPGEKKTCARHQEWRDRLDGEKNCEVSRAPDQVECGKGGNDLDFARPWHFWTMCRFTGGSTVGDDVVVPWEASGFPYKIIVPLGPALAVLAKTADIGRASWRE